MSLVGLDMRPFPYISPFGRICRLSRLNSLTLSLTGQVLSIPQSIMQAIRHGWNLPWVNSFPWDGVETDPPMQHQRKQIADLYPFQVYGGDPRVFWVDRLRACRQCLAYGYHSILHQLPWITRCPWHHESLVMTCTCGNPLLVYHRNRRARLLQCTCGIDHFDEYQSLLGLPDWPTDRILELTEHYLADAKKKQGTQCLLSRFDFEIDFMTKFKRWPNKTRIAISVPTGGNHHEIEHMVSRIRTIDEKNLPDRISPIVVKKTLEDWNNWEKNGGSLYSSFALSESSVDLVFSLAASLGRTNRESFEIPLPDEKLLKEVLVFYDGCWKTRPGILDQFQVALGASLLESALIPNTPLAFKRYQEQSTYSPPRLPLPPSVIEDASGSTHGQILVNALSEIAAAGAVRRMFQLAQNAKEGYTFQDLIRVSSMALILRPENDLMMNLAHFFHLGHRQNVRTLIEIYKHSDYGKIKLNSETA